MKNVYAYVIINNNYKTNNNNNIFFKTPQGSHQEDSEIISRPPLWEPLI